MCEVRGTRKMTNIVLYTYLSACSYFDIREQKIPVWILGTGVLLGLINMIIVITSDNRSVESVIIAVIPGILLSLFSKFSRGLIGEADGLLVMIVGFFFSICQIFSFLICAFLGSFLIAIALLTIKKCGKEHRIPFVPFLLFAAILVGVIKG